ncbi:hypothetical protein E4T52_13423 [Aureobasidium sp. EXF-3400]|nr:hypothetical protein E4T51_12472 [Aureobasidium sp. EXF-12344]KAI4771573.1 hypothetical protein E4T52_13423 [Aureobasidium sp. EXF-3400]
MSTEMLSADPSTLFSSLLTAELPQALFRPLFEYLNHSSPRPIFKFLQDLPSQYTREVRLRCLQLLLPRTELQLEYFLEPNTQPNDWRTATLVDRQSKTTWKTFRESRVADIFMQHIDTVTFTADWAKPSSMQLVVKFVPGGSLRTSIVYNQFDVAYERLDLEYIQLELEKITIYWKDVWKPAAMTFEVIHTMAERLGRMHREMVW